MNRLSGEVSPYLVQHATNPVHWWPWGDQAFAAARAANKPILLSIGYSACHWCHVMAHESFEDESTAAVMNDLFVSIKVDREERPDVDTVYMSALHTLGQQGGWPLTMFLDTDGRPFWGGTYFPKTARYGQPAFTSVLRSVAQAYATKNGDITSNAEAILAALTPSDRPAYGQAIGLPLLDQCAARIRDVFDPIHGGTRGAPKFPNPPLLELLWRGANRTGDESMRDAVLITLERMCRGGIFDHIGGGFARYSVDERWLVPHFEKMLYDNAQLIPLLALAAKHTGSPLLNAAATRSVDWLLRDMRSEDAFAASEDADSINADGHAEEGAFYVWSPEEVRAVLGSEAPAILRDYDITASGNFEGHSIPNRLAASGLSETLTAPMADQLTRLRQHRDKRQRPGRDDKILADWNGLMITGLVRAAELLEHPEWIADAERAYASVKSHLGGESILAHAYRAGKAVHPGFSSDHAAMALAAITLFEANGRPEYLHDSESWCRTLLGQYQTEAGILAMTVAGSSDLPIRPAPTADDAVPNANGMAAECFIRLFGLTGDVVWQNTADTLIAATTHALLANPYGHASLMNAIDMRLRRVDIAIGEDADALLEVTRSVPYPNRTLKIGQPANAVPSGHATVCVEGRCSLPTDNPATFKNLIVSELNPAQG